MKFTEVIEMEPVYTNLDEYFKDHPDEENEFYDDMAEIYGYDEIIELPEDYCA
jgi:hypothetical protein